MGILRRLMAKQKPTPPASKPRRRSAATGRLDVELVNKGPLVIRITKEIREWDVPGDGEADIWWRGYDLHDGNDRGWTWDDPLLSGAGLFISKIAGVQYYKGISLNSVRPGRPLRLVPEPNNQYDSNAVAVWDAAGEEMIGHLPREVAAPVAQRLAAQERLDAMCIAELIQRPGDARVGLRVLVAPPGVVAGWPDGD